MNEREVFMRALEAQPIMKGEVIFLLQGDGLFRAPRAVELWKTGFAPMIAIVGSADNRAYGSIPSREVRDEMTRLGAPSSIILFEDAVGAHTRAEADRAMELAKERDWKTILIVTSPHHQYRAFLTLLRAMQDAKLDLVLVNAVAPLSWTDETPWGKRVDLLQQEFDRISQYQKKDDVASYKDGIAYLTSL